MAYETGTATSYTDLLDKLKTFVTGSAITTEGNEWTVLRTSSTELILKGLGNSRDKEIYCGIRTFLDGVDSYQWEMRGFTGYDSGVTGLSGQPGASPAVYMHFHGASMTYWFFANGQRIIVVTKVSTVYEHGYLGFLLPYATPAQYPYPMVAGGSSDLSTRRWSSTDRNHSGYWNAGNAGCYLYQPDGSWAEINNRTGTSGTVSSPSSADRTIWPYWTGSRGVLSDLDTAPDGSYTLLPVIPNSPSSAGAQNIYGEFDGVMFLTGKNNASENTVTIGGDTYIVFQNIHRTAYEEYAAIKQA